LFELLFLDTELFWSQLLVPLELIWWTTWRLMLMQVRLQSVLRVRSNF